MFCVYVMCCVGVVCACVCVLVCLDRFGCLMFWCPACADHSRLSSWQKQLRPSHRYALPHRSLPELAPPPLLPPTAVSNHLAVGDYLQPLPCDQFNHWHLHMLYAAPVSSSENSSRHATSYDHANQNGVLLPRRPPLRREPYLLPSIRTRRKMSFSSFRNTEDATNEDCEESKTQSQRAMENRVPSTPLAENIAKLIPKQQ